MGGHIDLVNNTYLGDYTYCKWVQKVCKNCSYNATFFEMVFSSSSFLCQRKWSISKFNAQSFPFSRLLSLLVTLCSPVSDDDNLDSRNVLREIIQVEYKFLGNNFVPSVLTIGGMGLALHYKELAIQYDRAPLIMPY